MKLSPAYQRTALRVGLSQQAQATYLFEHLKPQDLTAAGLAQIWASACSIYTRLKILPSWSMVKDHIYQTVSKEEQNYYYRVLRKIRGKPRKEDFQYVLSQLQDFVALQRLAVAYQESLPRFESGDLDGVRSVLTDALTARGVSLDDLGMNYVADTRVRVRRRAKIPSRVIRTLITPLDQCLRNHGLRAQETGCVLAPTGVGKTRMLTHLARAATLQRKKVVYYTLQLPEEDIAEIFDAAFAGVYQSTIVDAAEQVIRRIDRHQRTFGENLIIKYFPRKQVSCRDLEAHLTHLQLSGFHADMIVVDFLNYLVPNQATPGRRDLYSDLQDAASEFILLCQSRSLVGWTAMQSNRAGLSTEVVTLAEIAESYAAAMEMTLVVSINRTTGERDEEKARLFIAKYSYGADSKNIPINTNYAKGSFYRVNRG